MEMSVQTLYTGMPQTERTLTSYEKNSKSLGTWRCRIFTGGSHLRRPATAVIDWTTFRGVSIHVYDNRYDRITEYSFTMRPLQAEAACNRPF